MTCSEQVTSNWDIAVEYADDDGEISSQSVDNAFRDWQSGEISSDENQAVFNMWQSGCELADGVEIDVETEGGVGEGEIMVDVSAPGSGATASVEASSPETGESISEQVAVPGTVTFGFSLPEGTQQLCADVVSVTPD